MRRGWAALYNSKVLYVGKESTKTRGGSCPGGELYGYLRWSRQKRKWSVAHSENSLLVGKRARSTGIRLNYDLRGGGEAESGKMLCDPRRVCA